MKKTLLLSSILLLTSGSLSAFQPSYHPETILQTISSNGKWAVSENYGTVVIVDLENNKSYTLAGAEGFQYSLGVGNCVSDNGIVGVQSPDTYDITIWNNGTWVALPMLSKESTGWVNGVNPDGSRIIGKITDYDFGAYNSPCVWTLQEDGNYKISLLPLPNEGKDFTGREAQFITVTHISDDGKTAVGQLQEYRGFISQPVVYKEGEDGAWTAEIVHPELLQASQPFPEYPGDDTPIPSEENYMTDDEMNAFNEAELEWRANGSNPDEVPLYWDFMGEESRAAYNAAKAIFDEWQAKFDAYYDVYFQTIENGTTFALNANYLSPNGRYFAQMEGDVYTAGKGMVFDLETGEYFSETSFCKYYDDGTAVMASMIRPAGATDFISFRDYVAEKAPAVKAWIEEHGTENDAPGNWYGGTLTASSNLKVFTTVFTSSFSGQTQLPDSWSYVFDLTYGDESGIHEVAKAEGLKLSAAGSTLLLEGEPADLEVYDLSGRLVFSAKAAQGAVETGLDSGVYVVRAGEKNYKLKMAR